MSSSTLCYPKIVGFINWRICGAMPRRIITRGSDRPGGRLPPADQKTAETPETDNLTVYFTVSWFFLNIFTLLSFIIYLFSTAKQHGLIHNATGRFETKR